MRIFFTSDLHLGHANILQFTSRKKKYKTIEEHDEDIIARWNKQVKPNDVVYLVGDIIWSTVKNPKEILSRLNGEKHLIIGNHDAVKMIQALKLGYKSATYFMKFHIAKNLISVSHYPYRWTLWMKIKKFFTNPFAPNWSKKYGAANYPKPDGKWLIHGHTHSVEKVNAERKMIHVGWDAWERLVSLDEIINIIK